MKRVRTLWISGCAVALISLSAVLPSRADDQDRGKVLNAFLEHVSQLPDADAAIKDQVQKTVTGLRGDPVAEVDAISESLMLIHPEYRAAVVAADEDVEVGTAALKPWTESADPYTAADANFHLARALVNAERFEQALPLLESITDKQSSFTLHAGAASYFTGVAYAELLQNQKAVDSLSQFLQRYQDAPERLRVSAWRQLQELTAIEEGQLADAHQRMDFSRRKLELEDSGDVTREQQDKIVGILAKLIKEQEKKECSSCNSKKNCQSEDQNQAKKSGQKSSDSQAGKSQTGGKSNNPNGVAERSFSDGPASPWSKLRDRSRDPAYTAIKDQLPAKYRDIVERYTEKAQSGQPADGS